MKEAFGGKKQETDKTGGMGGIFPSSGEKDKKPKEKSEDYLVASLKQKHQGKTAAEETVVLEAAVQQQQTTVVQRAVSNKQIHTHKQKVKT